MQSVIIDTLFCNVATPVLNSCALILEVWEDFSHQSLTKAVADPGFPEGGRRHRRTPEVVMNRKFCMSKRKNLDP